MHTDQEKLAFSERLKRALSVSAPKHRTAKDIAIQFNLRHQFEPVSNQAVHKWLTGQTIPTFEKIETLSKWLNVSTEWLRAGIEPTTNESVLTVTEVMLLKQFRQLSKHQQILVMEVMNNFVA